MISNLKSIANKTVRPNHEAFKLVKLVMIVKSTLSNMLNVLNFNALALNHSNRVGQNIALCCSPKISNKGYLEIGDDVKMDSSNNRVELFVEKNGSLVIGAGTKILGAEVNVSNQVVIGKNCIIRSHSIIMDDDLAESETRSTSIEIGDDVIIGERAVILSGVVIGAGARIEPESLVTKSVPAGTVFSSAPKYTKSKLFSSFYGNYNLYNTQMKLSVSQFN